jgi:hypothetical protein
MDGYTQRVRDSILPRSVADSRPKAFEEWFFTENYKDHGMPTEVCELCGKEEIRYHFEIENELTREMLWVGSHCILKFHLAIYEGERRLTEDEAKKKLHQLTEKMRLESCIEALKKLAASEDSEILRGALDYYKKNKKLTPKQAFVVFWRLTRNAIDHNPSFFKVNLRREKYRNDLRNMETGRVHLFWRALSPSQRDLAADLGHSPPPDVFKTR